MLWVPILFYYYYIKKKIIIIIIYFLNFESLFTTQKLRNTLKINRFLFWKQIK